MATATVKLTVNGYPNGVDNTQRRQILNGIAALLAGGTYLTNGLPFTWTFLSAEGGAFIPNFDATTPVWAEFQSIAGGSTGTAPITYLYDTVHGTLRIFIGALEVTTGTAVTADTIAFRAEFVRGV
jgi:hypothetical protein